MDRYKLNEGNAVNDVMALLLLPEKEDHRHTTSHHRLWSERGAKAYHGFARLESWDPIRVVAKSNTKVSKPCVGRTCLEFPLTPLQATEKLKQVLETTEYNFVTGVLAKFTETHHILNAVVVLEHSKGKMSLLGAVFYSKNDRLIFAMEEK